MLELARKFSSFSEPENKSDQYRLAVDSDELIKRFRDFEHLYQLSRNWKGTQLTIEGEVVNNLGRTPALDTLRCANGRPRATLREEYCQRKDAYGWGCTRLDQISEGLPSSRWHNRYGAKYWYHFGSFDEGKTKWILDKEELLGALSREAEAKRLNLCPFFDFSKAEAKIDAMPDVLDLEDDSSWEIRYSDRLNYDTMQQEAVGVQPKRIGEDVDSGGLMSIGLSFGLDSLAEEEGQPKARFVPEVSFDDIGGIDEIVQTVREVIELPLKHPTIFEHMGIAPHKGVLLYGPPGCGKTLIAKAVANEVDAHFISISGPELLNKYVGQSEQNLREVFEEARTNAPSIIFFDEIDAIAQTRSGDEVVRHASTFVNQLLTLMDGMELYENVCVIASTNRRELLDEAILRPGRIDYELEVRKPNLAGRKRILEIHTRDMPVSPDVDVEALAAAMDGFSGSDVAFVAREGAYNCMRRSLDLASLVKGESNRVSLEGLFVEQRDFLRAQETLSEHEA